MKLTVGTYNICHCIGFENYPQGGLGPVSIENTAAMIRSFHADFVSLNEVYSIGGEENVINQAEKLEKAAGFKESVYARGNFFPWGCDIGNAILSNYPIIKVGEVPVPTPKEEERRPGEDSWYENRVILSTVIDVGAEKPIAFITTHFGLNPLEKERMVAAMVKLLDETELPIILAGDFNSHPHTEVLQPIYDRLTSAADVVGNTDFTCESFRPLETLDYIFFSKEFKVRSFEVIKKVVSDHFPCVAELEYEC